MIDFKKNPKLGVFTYGILLISCLLEISVELGLHEFEDFASDLLTNLLRFLTINLTSFKAEAILSSGASLSMYGRLVVCFSVASST